LVEEKTASALRITPEFFYRKDENNDAGAGVKEVRRRESRLASPIAAPIQ
jgi:hypothetical protein